MNALLEHIPDSDHIMLHDLYERYPDFNVDIGREKEILEAHDILIWQHPLYWYSAPALLKQWIDMALEFGWAYGPGGTALEGKKVMNAFTSGGARHVYCNEGYNRYTIREFLSFLRANGVEATILDHDSDRVDLLRKLGFKVYYGDATRVDLLKSAGAEDAKLMVVAIDDRESTLKLVEIVQKHFPHLELLVRAGHRSGDPGDFAFLFCRRLSGRDFWQFPLSGLRSLRTYQLGSHGSISRTFRYICKAGRRCVAPVGP